MRRRLRWGLLQCKEFNLRKVLCLQFACTKLARGLENLVAPKVGQTLSVVTQYKDNIFDELWAGFDEERLTTKKKPSRVAELFCLSGGDRI